MSRIICIFLACILVFSLTGCGSSSRSDKSSGVQKPSLIFPQAQQKETMSLESVAPETYIAETVAPTVEIPELQIPTIEIPETQAPTIYIPEPTEEVISGADANMIPGFDKNERRKINIFLSNFAEQRFDSYPAEDYRLLQFVRTYCKINRPSAITYNPNDNFEYISKSTVDELLNRFFGETIIPHATYTFMHDVYGQEIYYEDGEYSWAAADGEMYDYVAIATKMVKNSDGTYTVEFDIYEAFMVDNIKDCYYMNSAQAEKDPNMHKTGSGQAVVKDYAPKNSYQLISYTEY